MRQILLKLRDEGRTFLRSDTMSATDGERGIREFLHRNIALEAGEHHLNPPLGGECDM